MNDTIYEEYTLEDNRTFMLYDNLIRTDTILSPAMNWHENLEIELCSEGNGRVLLDGEKLDFNEGEIVVVNSNVIHHTGTDRYLKYSALIVDSAFCRQMGIDYSRLIFDKKINNKEIARLFKSLIEIHNDNTITFKTAKENSLLLKILISLAENYSTLANERQNYNNVKATIMFIRENYNRKISLDEIAKNVFTDKYLLSRQFKKATGQTIVSYINNYRCQKAAHLIRNEATVTEAAIRCGFENLSFFTKTFNKYIGINPSQLKKKDINKISNLQPPDFSFEL